MELVMIKLKAHQDNQGKENVDLPNLMASGIFNTTHPILQFNVLHSRKPWHSRTNFYKFVNGSHVPCYLGLWVQYHNESLEHHKH
jgi:hypothetical protein